MCVPHLNKKDLNKKPDLQFLNAYLEPRIGYVTIEGALSEAFAIADSVFEGTVLGPSLWNTFFSKMWH